MLSRDSVPWKTCAFGFEERVLNEAQLDWLSRTHDLDLDDLRGLSAELTVVLDERRYLGRDDLKTKQRARGQKEVAAAIKDIRAAESKLAKARERLGAASFEHPFPGTGMPNPATTQLARLDRAEAVIRDTRVFLEGAVQRDEVTWAHPADARLMRDERRRMACSALFDFWIASGRRLSYTTNPISNHREGPLVRFVNDVVRCLTEPPSKLGGDAIKSEIEAHLASGRPAEPSGPLRRARDAEQEGAELLGRLDAETPDAAVRLRRIRAVRDDLARRGQSEGRLLDLRLALRLSEVLVAQAEEPEGKGRALTELATRHAAIGEMTRDPEKLREALILHRQAVSILSREPIPHAWADAQFCLVLTLDRLDRINGDRAHSDEILATYEAVLRRVSFVSENALWAQAKMLLGVATARSNDHKTLLTAANHLRDARVVAERGEDRLLEAHTLLELGQCLAQVVLMGNQREVADEAAQHATAAVEILHTLDAPDLLDRAEAIARDLRNARRGPTIYD